MKITKKQGWLLRDFVIVGILFGGIIALFILTVGNMASNYNDQTIVSPSFSNHYNQLSGSLSRLNSAQSAVQGNGSGLNLIGTFNVAFNSMFTVVAMIWDSVGIYANMVTNFSSDFSILPKQPITILLLVIMASITAYLIFVWLSSVTRGKI